jgi:hypothetical protein
MGERSPSDRQQPESNDMSADSFEAVKARFEAAKKRRDDQNERGQDRREWEAAHREFSAAHLAYIDARADRDIKEHAQCVAAAAAAAKEAERERVANLPKRVQTPGAFRPVHCEEPKPS